MKFVNKHECAQILGVSPDTLKVFRNRGLLVEGIHWVRWNSRSIRYNQALIEDWAANQGDPQAHQRAVENFQASLLSNQPKRRGRPSQAKTPMYQTGA